MDEVMRGGGMWTCEEGEMGRMEKEVGWTRCMQGGLVKLMRGDGLIEVTVDSRRGGQIVGDVKQGEVRSMESGVR